MTHRVRPRTGPIPRPALLLALVLLIVAVAGCGGTATSPPTTKTPGSQTPGASLQGVAGSPDSGDPYYPSLGNGGYDVQNYDISLDIDPVSGRIAGMAAVDVLASQDLSSFYLDLRGLDVESIAVDGVAAAFERSGNELKTTLPAPVAQGARFTANVSYSGIPAPISAHGFRVGWQKDGHEIFTLDEPEGASTWFPVNETPRDKATYTLRLTVPQGYTAVGNGVLTSTDVQRGKTTFVWVMDRPMAGYLAAVNVGKFVRETSTSAGGVTIRNYFAPDLTTRARTAFARAGEVIDYFGSLFGPYPFAAYGVVVPDAETEGAMENQTISLFGRNVVIEDMSDPVEAIIYLGHELAHEWFGNSVTIERWDDIWLNEGFATYATWLWLEHDLSRQALEEQVRSSIRGLRGLEEPPPGAPGTENMFGDNVYQRGGLTLHALRLTVGDGPFFAVLRAWAERYRYGNATTAEFVALVKEKAQQVPAADIDALFQAWLHGRSLPALPSARPGA